MPPRWIYNIHLNWEIIVNVWWNLCCDRKWMCCTCGVISQTDKLSSLYHIKKPICNFRDLKSKSGILDCCSCTDLYSVKNGHYFSIQAAHWLCVTPAAAFASEQKEDHVLCLICMKQSSKSNEKVLQRRIFWTLS